MIAWSKGLGKRDLNINFAKCDITRGEGNVYLNGTLYPTLWACKVTFTPEDIPGLLNFLFSRAMIGLFVRNITGVFTYFRDAFILRRMGKKPIKGS